MEATGRPTTVIPALRRGYLDERGTSAPNRPQPSSRPPVRRPKLDLGPKRRSSAARRTGMPCERALADHSTPGAANSVGYGPQIKFGATEKEHRVMEATGHLPPSRPRPTTVIPAPRHRHTRAPFSVIPALRRGYLAERGTSAPNRLQPSSRPPVRRPKLDLGPIRRPPAARRPEMPCKRRQRSTPPPALRTALGLAPKSSLGRRILEHGMMEATGRPTTVIPALQDPSYPRSAAGISTCVAPKPRAARRPFPGRAHAPLSPSSPPPRRGNDGEKERGHDGSLARE